MKLPRLSAVTWAGLAFLVVAAAALIVRWTADFFDEWALNIAPEAASIAATVLIVERIVRGEQRRRIAPRVRRAHRDIEDQLGLFGYAVAREYAHTHDASYERPPGTLHDLLAHWLDAADNAELRPTQDDSLLTAAEHLGDRLDHVRDGNLDVLDPGFAVAMDDLARELRGQARVHALFEALDVRGLPEDRYVASARACVGAVRTFTATFVERSTLNPGIADEYLQGLEVTRDGEMRRRGRRGN